LASVRRLGALTMVFGAGVLMVVIIYAAYGLPPGRVGGTPIGNLLGYGLFGFIALLFIVLGLFLIVKGPTLPSRKY
jgi:hypothetical protein